MSRPVTPERLESLRLRYMASRRGSPERRHLRRAYERAVERAAKAYERKAGRS